jgi:pimeloyl-ACP methyl ester carboxylesterase
MLFIHGIGVGLYPYTSFLRDLDKANKAGGDDSDVGLIALEIMPISSRITHPALEKDIMVREILAIVQKHGWEKFILVSHSYGSVIATSLLKSPLIAERVGSVVLIDPVSFLLHLPDVAYNFTARLPVRANEYQLWYFGSKDLGVAHTLARRFFWSESILWKEDLGLKDVNGGEGRNVTVTLSGRDLIVDTNAVRRYLTAASPEGGLGKRKVSSTTGTKTRPKVTEIMDKSTGASKGKPWSGSGLEILWFEELDHAQVFDSKMTRRHIIKAIKEYSAKG